MIKKSLILIVIMFSSLTIVEAETIEEKLASLSSKLDELSETIDNLATTEKYPVGSIYISTSSTNPGSLFGGTWEIYSVDKQLVGNGSNGTTTYTAGSTGGGINKTLATTNMPSHNHSLKASGTVSSTFTGSKVTSSSAGAHTHYVNMSVNSKEATGYGMRSSSNFKDRVLVTGGTLTSTSASFSASTHSITPTGTVSSTFTGTSATSSSVGSSTSFSVQNPYVTVFMWKRTA